MRRERVSAFGSSPDSAFFLWPEFQTIPFTGMRPSRDLAFDDVIELAYAPFLPYIKRAYYKIRELDSNAKIRWSEKCAFYDLREFSPASSSFKH